MEATDAAPIVVQQSGFQCAEPDRLALKSPKTGSVPSGVALPRLYCIVIVIIIVVVVCDSEECGGCGGRTRLLIFMYNEDFIFGMIQSSFVTKHLIEIPSISQISTIMKPTGISCDPSTVLCSKIKAIILK